MVMVLCMVRKKFYAALCLTVPPRCRWRIQMPPTPLRHLLGTLKLFFQDKDTSFIRYSRFRLVRQPIFGPSNSHRSEKLSTLTRYSRSNPRMFQTIDPRTSNVVSFYPNHLLPITQHTFLSPKLVTRKKS